MELNILDSSSNWCLAKTTLLDYIRNINDSHFEYEVQRGIVSNKYLDTILDSIYNNNTLNPITLVCSDKDLNDNNLSSFDILDGLQRTYRLWIYYRIALLAKQKQINSYKDFIPHLAYLGEDCIDIISLTQVKSLFNDTASININNLEEIYGNFSIYIYLWKNLSEKEIIKKMLILNAGQKQMTNQHQYELIYLHIFKNLNLSELNIHRFGQKKKNNNEPSFNITLLIIGIQSLLIGKPIRLSSDKLKKELSVFYENEYFIDSKYLNSDFLKFFIKNIHRLCSAQIDKEWLIKETTISGVMGGIGKYIRDHNLDFDKDFQDCINRFCTNNLEIQNFYKAYDALSSVRINIGTTVRNAIATYVYKFLSNEGISWEESFNTTQL